jgi:hypothetical protein
VNAARNSHRCSLSPHKYFMQDHAMMAEQGGQRDRRANAKITQACGNLYEE